MAWGAAASSLLLLFYSGSFDKKPQGLSKTQCQKGYSGQLYFREVLARERWRGFSNQQVPHCIKNFLVVNVGEVPNSEWDTEELGITGVQDIQRAFVNDWMYEEYNLALGERN